LRVGTTWIVLRCEGCSTDYEAEINVYLATFDSSRSIHFLLIGMVRGFPEDKVLLFSKGPEEVL